MENIEFMSEEYFLKLLEKIKYIDGKKVKLDKGKKIFELVKSYDKFSQFLINQFLEKYVKYICLHKDKIKLYEHKNDVTDSQKDIEYINITEDEFKKILQKITIEGEHLYEDEIEKGVEAFLNVKSNKELDVAISNKFFKEYVLYLYNNRYQIRKFLKKQINKIKKDKSGDYLIDDEYIVRENNDGGKNSPFWISVERCEDDKIEGEITKDIVVKNMFSENKKETALIAEEIARELRLPVAQYYPAKYIGKKYTSDEKRKFDDNTPYISERIVITPNFLEEGEELITGDRINKYEMDVKEMPKFIREYLKKEGVQDDEIEKLITDYRIIMIYNCFINHRDCHNGNWGYIKNPEGKFKIAHIFDLEGALCENSQHIRAIHAGDYWDDEEILYELLQDDKARENATSFLNLDMEQVINNVNLSKGILVPADMAKDTCELIETQKELLEKVIHQIYNEKLSEIKRTNDSPQKIEEISNEYEKQ